MKGRKRREPGREGRREGEERQFHKIFPRFFLAEVKMIEEV